MLRIKKIARRVPTDSARLRYRSSAGGRWSLQTNTGNVGIIPDEPVFSNLLLSLRGRPRSDRYRNSAMAKDIYGVCCAPWRPTRARTHADTSVGDGPMLNLQPLRKAGSDETLLLPSRKEREIRAC